MSRRLASAGTTLWFMALLSISLPAAEAAGQSAPIGTWRGTSTCTDLAAAPACRDEVVVYEFTAGAKAGIVHWKADKIVDGQREPMGEMDVTYDKAEACWRSEFQSARVHSVWCLIINGAHMTGTARLLPGKQTIRRVDLRKE